MAAGLSSVFRNSWGKKSWFICGNVAVTLSVLPTLLLGKHLSAGKNMSVQRGRVTATFCPPGRVSGGRRCRDEPSLQRYCRVPVWKRALDVQEAAACAAAVWVFCDRMADSLISAFFIADKQHANVLEWPPLHHAAAVAFHVLQSRWGWGRGSAVLTVSPSKLSKHLHLVHLHFACNKGKETSRLRQQRPAKSEGKNYEILYSCLYIWCKACSRAPHTLLRSSVGSIHRPLGNS